MVEKHLNYCEEDCIDSVDRLKGHLLKCKKLPRNIRVSLKIQDPDPGSNIVQLDKSDVNSILARFLIWLIFLLRLLKILSGKNLWKR